MAFQPQPARPSPQPTSGFGFWLRQNIFNSPLNSIISLLMIILISWSLFNLVTWIVAESDWQIVWNNQRLLAVFQYPSDLLWRPMTCIIIIMSLFGLNAGVSNEGIGHIIRRAFYWILGLIVIIAIVALVYWESVRLYWVIAALLPIVFFFIGNAIPQIAKFLSWGWVLLWFVCTFILVGFGGGHGHESTSPMRYVNPNLWGGMLLSFFLSITGIVLCFPIGIGLALGRESKLPIIRTICTGYIEILRGSPLVSWLFLASVMLPLAINATPAGIIRAQVAIILFAAAYMAENVRGGLQALPKGQGEAAHALGLSPWDTTSIIILPQALRAVIPAIVGLFIGLFKDTSLVLIVGLVDIFAMLNQIANQPDATLVAGGILKELFIFGSLFYWFFCYRMSIASRQLEKQLGLGTR